MKASLRLCTVAVAITLGACASTSEVRVDQAANGLSSCKTFDWLRASETPESFTEQRVRAEVFRQLEEKGYPRVTERPDCKITYLLDTHERPASKPRVGVGVGGGSGGLGGGVGVSIPVPGGNDYDGLFSLSVIDVNSNSEVWNGSIEAASKEAELTSEEAAALVEKVLEKFPSR